MDYWVSDDCINRFLTECPINLRLYRTEYQKNLYINKVLPKCMTNVNKNVVKVNIIKVNKSSKGGQRTKKPSGELKKCGTCGGRGTIYDPMWGNLPCPNNCNKGYIRV